MAVSGVVKSWNLAKGFGFVESSSDQTAAFVHITDLNGGRLVEGAAVRYDTRESDRKPRKGEAGKLIAYNITGKGVKVASKKKGSLHGVVKSWKHSKSLGFIKADDGTDVYAHASSFGGGTLKVGKEVNFDAEDVEHKSGRKVATNVSGEGVVPLGSHQGKVKKWVFEKGYGFVAIENPTDDITEAFVHRSAIGDGYLEVGRTLHFNLESKDGKKVAVDVSGPAVRDADFMPFPSYPAGRGGGAWDWSWAYVTYGGKGGKGFKGGKGTRGGKGGRGRF